MKKLITSLIFIFVSLTLFAQTDGISYQAVIIGPDTQELPGVDAEGNILPEATIAIRFTILDSNNSAEYQEVQTTNTDAFGRINLLIGSVNPDEFTMISWDGTNKDLKVEIDFSGGGSSFVDMSREQLTFVPYAYHRNITAAGTLKVDDATELNSELLVKGPTNLESILGVSGDTDLDSDLLVKGATWLNDSLNVNKGSSTNLSGSLTVEGKAAFKGETGFNTIVVDSTSNLNGQVTIDANLDANGDDSTYEAYPLLVQGSSQGIGIKVNGNRGIANNYVSFWDDDKMWGRIEGITLNELENDDGYQRALRLNNFNVAAETINVILAGIDVYSAATNSTADLIDVRPCVGAGACVVSPGPVRIAWSIQDLIIKIANAVETGVKLVIAIKDRKIYLDNSKNNIGVSYQSGAGDYAEWLPKENASDVFQPGELVGVKNGHVTKKTWGVEKIMIVSTNPIVLGNMPQPEEQRNSVKIAFMGQVPTRVLGKVAPGDFILPNELGIGFAKAVSPKDMITRDYEKVAGVAWNVIDELVEGLNLVNVAVGINSNDLSKVVASQEEELKALRLVYDQLRIQIERSNKALESLIPGYAEKAKIVLSNESPKIKEDQKNVYPNENKENLATISEDDIIYFEISKEQIEVSIEIAQEQYKEMFSETKQTNKLSVNNIMKTSENRDVALIPIEDHPFWQRMATDPAYKEEIVQFIQSKLEKAIHTHKQYAHYFTEFKIKE